MANLHKKIKKFTGLKAWQIAHRIYLEVCGFAKLLPEEEKYSKVYKLRELASFIPAKIAEGHNKPDCQENINLCKQARISLDEIKNIIVSVREAEQVPMEACNNLLDLIFRGARLLEGHIRDLETKKEKT